MADKEFDTPQDALAHYGKKGMKWGVRNERESGGSGRSSSDTKPEIDVSGLEEYKALAAAIPDKKGLEASKQLQKNKEKFHAKADNNSGPELPGVSKDLKREAKASKFDESASKHQKRIDEIDDKLGTLTNRQWVKRNQLNNERLKAVQERDANLKNAERVREGKLTSGQRKALIAAGVGAVVVGGIAYSAHKQNAAMRDLEKRAADGDVDAKLELFQKHVQQAQIKTWMFGSFVQPTSWDRDEYELPAGHTFHRISTRDESAHGFAKGTYATHSETDFNRYVAGFRQEKGPDAEFHHVTFTSKKPVKVPDLNVAVEAMRKSMATPEVPVVSRKAALQQYTAMSGGGWDDAKATKFFGTLKQMGYGAIVDEMDAGVIGEKPVVFFDYDNATPKKSRLLDSGEIENREKSVELMDKPPRKA